MKKYIVLIFVVLLVCQLFAGRYAGDFMVIGSGVKALSMGGAYTAVADEGTAIYWNASGIAQIRDNEAFAMRAFCIMDLQHMIIFICACSSKRCDNKGKLDKVEHRGYTHL